MRERVKGGELLSDAFAAQQVFPKMYTTTLMAGEKSGNMEEVLSRYIQYQRMVQTFRKKLLVSLVYPALLISVVTVMLIFLITYVVPKFADLFNDLGRSCQRSRCSCWPWPERAEVCVGRVCWFWSWRLPALALEAERSRRGDNRPVHAVAAADRRDPAEISGG